MHRVCAERFTPRSMRRVGLLLCLMAAGTALAQEAPPPANVPASGAAPRERGLPPPDELEPAVDTTKSSSGATPSATAPADATRATGKRRGADGADAAKASAGSKSSARKGPDRLELDPTDITGNRELPKVLYIVPWKRSDLGDLAGRPVNSLLDEVLQPLDRDVFQRENRYYDALKPGAAAARHGAVQDSGDKP